ncbi:MAG: pyridoxal phosphate-dependent aminotransferase [Nannocystaceae bacterium]
MDPSRVFSRRADWGSEAEPFHAFLVDYQRRRGGKWLDLTVSNPTRVGLVTPGRIATTIARFVHEGYQSEPLGLASARQAIADYYGRRGVRCGADRVWLSASTSESYAHLIALCCDPGDAIFVPEPGYPLFDFIADLMGVKVVRYLLAYDGEWHIDVSVLRERLAQSRDRGLRVGALISVAPSNPVGSYLSRSELATLHELGREHHAALIIDEVFSDYVISKRPDRVRYCVESSPWPTFTVSGLSKVAAAPQFKLGWGVIDGPTKFVDEARERLCRISDTFLNTAASVQLALGQVMVLAESVQMEIRGRIHGNWRELHRQTDDTPVSVLDCEGGWSALLRLPQYHPRLDRDRSRASVDVAWAMALLESGVQVQPGSLFGLVGPYVVLSTITQPAAWREGVGLLVAVVSD